MAPDRGRRHRQRPRRLLQPRVQRRIVDLLAGQPFEGAPDIGAGRRAGEGRADRDHFAHQLGMPVRRDPRHDPAERNADQRHFLAGLRMHRGDPLHQPLALGSDRAHAQIAAEIPSFRTIAEPVEIAPHHEGRAIRVGQPGEHYHRAAVARRHVFQRLPFADQPAQSPCRARAFGKQRQCRRRNAIRARYRQLQSHCITPKAKGVHAPIRTPATRSPPALHSLQVLNALYPPRAA